MAAPEKTALPDEDRGQVNNETVLKIAKEITVKFIEVGRVTPVTFPAVFVDVYNTIEKAVRGSKP